MEYYSGYTFDELQPCLAIMHEMLCHAPSNQLQVVFRKYSRQDYLRVAAIQPRSTAPTAR